VFKMLFKSDPKLCFFDYCHGNMVFETYSGDRFEHF
jgi:hypothetical protein